MTGVPNSPGQVRMGLFLSGWLDPAAPSPRSTVDTLLDRIPAARAAGFSSIWVGQHILADPWPVLDTSTYLGLLAGATGDLEIGGVYLLPLSHPIRLAESLVTLDNLSGGRFALCAALGWAQREFDALGVPIRQRAGRFEETLDVMRRLWESEESFDFEGRYFSFRDIKMTARPQRPGGIPAWIAASSAPGVRRAARVGDSWLGSSHTPYSVLADLATEYDRALTEAGRRPARRPLLRHCMVAETDELAEARFTEAYNAYYRALGSWGIFKEVVGEKHATGEPGDDVPPGRVILGSPDTVVAQLGAYQRLGFDEFIFQVGTPGTPESAVRESLALLGSEVLPRLGVPARV
ncbi:LLM class flavin-dependent oxidoreductase [Amycolatopsis acidicola]|uniref:LLM class flavin-dependent oxidoreductase n=1 Tax=Amycolatopsis acidicola TaxID=2596893 RepID=A0A5N0UZK7_9PSEU|nr:LLM class flavin-dependent oxidoreductase [Amycolatopsis acidicola]KAA9159410.1 LLM class flavin-dependent oxidoreductase [Amycolatopsis acidicola]